VKVPIDEAWAVLTDLERVAPCMPGFQLQAVDGDEYRGVVKVKVGPMIAQYQGVASFLERDASGHRAVVRAEGKEARGQGNAAATITATLAAESGGTHVTLHTDLTITGRVAQFGRGVLADVSAKLLRQFVQALEADVLSGADGAQTPTDEAPAVDAPPSSAPSRPAPDESPGEAPAVATPPRPARHGGPVADPARGAARPRARGRARGRALAPAPVLARIRGGPGAPRGARARTLLLPAPPVRLVVDVVTGLLGRDRQHRRLGAPQQLPGAPLPR
jgi:carbon monoxide dehydrogenase subunit G